MGIRRKARERAVQFLFQHDLNAIEPLEEALNEFFKSQETSASTEDPGAKPVVATPQADSNGRGEDEATRGFAEPLIRGVIQYREALDAEIQKHAHNWDLKRMATIDRNVLRLAVYEMRHRDDIPPVVSINEAVEIAKKFSTQDSGKFVNGILDRIKADLLRPARISAT